MLAAMTMACLAGCSWFGAGTQSLPQAAEIVVTGAPPGSKIFVDGAAAADVAAVGAGPEILQVTPGSHTVEVRLGDPVVYREETEVGRGDRRIVTVLSGTPR